MGSYLQFQIGTLFAKEIDAIHKVGIAKAVFGHDDAYTPVVFDDKGVCKKMDGLNFIVRHLHDV